VGLQAVYVKNAGRIAVDTLELLFLKNRSITIDGQLPAFYF
jgi:hypothetical protein